MSANATLLASCNANLTYYIALYTNLTAPSTPPTTAPASNCTRTVSLIADYYGASTTTNILPVGYGYIIYENHNTALLSYYAGGSTPGEFVLTYLIPTLNNNACWDQQGTTNYWLLGADFGLATTNPDQLYIILNSGQGFHTTINAANQYCNGPASINSASASCTRTTCFIVAYDFNYDGSTELTYVPPPGNQIIYITSGFSTHYGGQSPSNVNVGTVCYGNVVSGQSYAQLIWAPTSGTTIYYMPYNANSASTYTFSVAPTLSAAFYMYCTDYNGDGYDDCVWVTSSGFGSLITNNNWLLTTSTNHYSGFGGSHYPNTFVSAIAQPKKTNGRTLSVFVMDALGILWRLTSFTSNAALNSATSFTTTVTSPQFIKIIYGTNVTYDIIVGNALTAAGSSSIFTINTC
jgi:hypothetical protein